MSKLINFSPNPYFLRILPVFYVRHWLILNSSSTHRFMFTLKLKGGLGTINPGVMYYKHLAFILRLKLWWLAHFARSSGKNSVGHIESDISNIDILEISISYRSSWENIDIWFKKHKKNIKTYQKESGC